MGAAQVGLCILDVNGDFHPAVLQALFTLQPQEMSDRMLASHEEAMRNGDTLQRQHTLEEFAIDHFRPPPKRTLSRAVKRRTRVSVPAD